MREKSRRTRRLSPIHLPDTREESNSSPVLNGDRDSILTWEDIPGNSRLPSPIAVQVKEKKPTRSNRVEGRYLVADLNGKEFELKVWQKHGLNIEWDVDTWYVLREARGTVWESDGEVHRLLDSTRDLTASECETSVDADQRDKCWKWMKKARRLLISYRRHR